MSLPPNIDPAAIANLRELGGDDGGFLAEIIDIFLSDMPQRIAELEIGLKTVASDKFMRAAHSIKGSAANLGAMRLQDTADRLEQQARAVNHATLGANVAEVKAAFEAARIELEGYRPKL